MLHLCMLIVLLLGITIMHVVRNPSLPTPFSSASPTFEWPKPNSDAVKFQETKVKTDLGVKEMLVNLKTSSVQVRKALIAGDECDGPAELHDKMESVDNAVGKIEESVRDIFDSFQNGAKTALPNLKSMWDFAVDGEMAKAVQQVQSVCEATEVLAEQVDSLKGSMHSKKSEIRQALQALESYHEKAKDKYKSQQRKLSEEVKRYSAEKDDAQRLAREAKERAHGAERNAQREMEELEARKAKDAAGENDDQNPLKKRRAEFLIEKEKHEAEVEEYKRIVVLRQLEIDRVEKQNETENSAFKCIDDALTKMKEAAGRVSIPTVSAFLFEERLKKDCTKLLDKIKSLDNAFSLKETTLLQVCDNAKKLFTTWQALLNVS